MNSKSLILLVIVLLMPMMVSGADETLDLKLDRNIYAAAEDVVMSGAIYDGETGLADANISIELDGDIITTLSDSEGEFTETLTAPDIEGEYNITVSYDALSVVKTIKVSAVEDIKLFITSSGSEPFEMIIFTDNITAAGMTDSGGITGTILYGNFTNNGTVYYAILRQDDITSEYITLFLSTDNDFSNIKYQYLGEGSKVNLAGSEYAVAYIGADGGKAILLKLREPIFYGTGNEWAGLFILGLNSTDGIINNVTTLSVEGLDGDGNYENLTNETGSPANVIISQRYNSITYYGMKLQPLLISIKGGVHKVIVGGLGHVSYFVKKFSLKNSVETVEGNLVSTIGAGQTVALKAAVVDLDTGTSISGATVNVLLISPNGSKQSYTLTVNSANLFTANATLGSQTGEYVAIFTANYSGSIIKKEYRFRVKSVELFMKSFSPEKGEGNGFPPNSNGYILVGGRDLSTGELAGLGNSTNNCTSSLIYLAKIIDEKKVNVLSNFSTFPLSGLWMDPDLPGVPPSWVQQEVSEEFGSGACVIKFVTPSATGTYKLEVEANISGTINRVKSYLDVTSLFVYGMTSNCVTGGWSDSVAPGSKVCIKTLVYDAAVGQKIDADNITDINLVEVYSMEEGIITDQVTNVQIVAFPGGDKGISFYSSNSSLGDHDVVFRVKANISTGAGIGLGHGWFRTQLWNVWVHPDCESAGGGGSGGGGGFCTFGANSNISFEVEAFTAGFGGGQGGLTATLSTIRNIKTGETIQISADESVSCTTVQDNSSSLLDSNSSAAQIIRPATCTLTLPTPDAGWESGDYDVRFTVADTDDNQMTVYSSFRVENFRFWVWNRNWEISKSQDAQFDITMQDFSGTGLDGTVIATKMYYMGTHDNWLPPIEITLNGSAEQPVTGGHGTYTLDSSVFSSLKSGYYDVIFTATTSAGRQTARTGLNIRSFVLFAAPIGNNWENSYEIDGNMTINISAFDSINWSTYPPTGVPHVMSNVIVKRIDKEGMWDKAYKLGSKGEIGDTNDCSGTSKSCLLTVPLAGFAQSHYNMVIEVTDNVGNKETTNYWFRTETYTITIPEVQDWRSIPASNRLTDKVIIALSTDKSCGTSSDTVTEPVNVSNCLADAEQRLPTIYNDWYEYNAYNLRTVFLLDKTNQNNTKLYVNPFNDTWESIAERHYNFTHADTIGPLVVGNNFTDSNGYRWRITGLDGGLGRVMLQSLDGVVRTRTIQAANGNSENSVEYMYQYLVDKSLSKSGIFLYSGSNDWEDKFWDDEWASIDLDGDGKYNCDPDTGECEEYYMLLSDMNTAGKYDTLLMSATRNMTEGVDSYDGFSGGGAGDIKFNDNANPVYLLNIIYSETNGVGKYKIVTTTNKAGWPGRNLGVFQVGSEHIKIPVMVASPSTKTGLANKTVILRTLRTFGGLNFQETSIPPAIADTADNGIALLDLNLSTVKSGEYMIIMEVNDSGSIVTSGNDWDNPRIELRSFSISNLFGLKARVNGLLEWSEGNNNLFTLNSSEAYISENGDTELRMSCGNWNNEFNLDTICHVDDWRYRELWLNISDQNNVTLIIDTTPEDYYLWSADLNGSNIRYLEDTVSITDEFGGQLKYIFSNVSLDPIQETFFVNTSRRINHPGSSCDFNVTLLNADGGSNNIRWTVQEVCPWSSGGWYIENDIEHNIGEHDFLWGLFNISSIDDGVSATFNMLTRTMTLSTAVQGIAENLEDNSDGRIRVVSDAFGSGYDLYIYDGNTTKTRNNLEGWSGGMLDTVALVDGVNNTVVNTYAVGDPIAELDDKAVVRASPWEQYVYLSNLSFGGNIIYPLPWACDENKYYVATFTEEDLGFNLYDCGMSGQLSATTYYIMLFDSVCDGVWQPSSAKFDDDNVMDDDWIDAGGNNWVPYDFTQLELGEENPCMSYGGGASANQSEQWMDIGRESYPVSITEYDVDSGYLDLFRTRYNVNPGENTSLLTLWAQARNFDGTNIDGTITLDKATGVFWGCGVSSETNITVNATDGDLVDGSGYLNVDLSAVNSSQPTLRFKIQDGSNPLKYEYITKSFWYGPAEMMKEPVPEEGGEPGGCDGIFQGGGGAGGSGGGFFDEKDAEIQYCIVNPNSSECNDAFGCVWLTADLFGTGKPSEDECMPCIVFDDNQDACEMMNDTCEWMPAGPGGAQGTGLCDPIGEGSGGGGGGYVSFCSFSNSSSCFSASGCIWLNESYGFADPGCNECVLFDGNQTMCNLYSSSCAWLGDPDFLCDPVCNVSVSNETCGGDCMWNGTTCIIKP